MKKFERILVCAKQEEDLRMLENSQVLSQAAHQRQIHVLHIVPEEPTAGGGESTAGELSLDRLETVANETLRGSPGVQIVCVTVTGGVLPEILRYAMEEDMDLIVLGRRSAAGAILAHRVARKATCSVLVLPEGAPARVSRILVPVRDTECSARAVQAASWVAGGSGGVVSCLNLFQVGSGYSKAGVTLEQQVAMLRKVADHDVQRMLVGVDTDGLRTETKSMPDLYAQPVSLILEEVEKTSADLIVIGSRGRTGAAGVLLGTVTEELISGSPVPVLAVKRKGEQIGIVRALLSLA